MVVQAAVTPSRSRRLLFKLPVATLRRNSEERPKLMAKDLLDLVASHFNLKEKEYFGISYTDDTFYIESISYLKDNATIELFFLNAKSCIYKEAKGDFTSEDRVIEHYRKLSGQSRGQAIVNDPHVSSKKLKKQRKTSYLNALKKLQDIENSINEYRIRSGKKPTQRASLIIEDDPQVAGTPTFSPVSSPHKGLPPRPPSHSRPPPPQSLEGLRHLHYQRSDYDKSPIKPRMWSESSLDEPYERVKKRSSHSSSHRRFPSTGSCETGGSNSLQNSPVRTLPHWNSQSSMPSTPDLRTRNYPFRGRSSSLESQGKLLSLEGGPEAELSPDLFLSGPQRTGSNGSVVPDDCSSCTSHSSSEHCCPPAGANPNYRTLAEDSPSRARQRQRQRHKSAGHLGTSSSGSMPNLAARNGGTPGTAHQGVYLNSQSQPSSQYRIKEYPLYPTGSSPGAVVVRSLESDQEGHYSVKAQFKTSNSYTAGGLYKEGWGSAGEDGEGSSASGSARLTPSRSQIVRTPSVGREGGGKRAAVSEELRCWYHRSSGSLKERHASSNTGRVGTLTKASPAASPHSQRSGTPCSESAATPPCSPQHILNWQSGDTAESSPTEDRSPSYQSTEQ
ncbi:FERM domain-containing protein 4A [Bagarius yarrelli]|uniref:FERM domain-containing protein 4A n=1 Tax=Bagarius yarrelli TaxID=175774 RepID=A0A556TQF4_BAGYA|nr:FERM domain-containing protein 4A [Bagarius yarrelli]